MPAPVLLVHGPARPRLPIVLDSPHSGFHFPDDFGAALPEDDLRDGEDCHVDALWQPAADKGIPLLAAQLPRTYLDVNRDAADIDPELLDAPWPGPLRPSGKAAIGKALVWRTLDDGRPIYRRRLSVGELQQRIERCHAPYHAALRGLLDAAHADFGAVWHLNCHSMNPVSGRMGQEGEGVARPDIVLGDRDGSSCDASFTAFVRRHFERLGHRVAVNDPFKGVELVRAYADPPRGRHSLQIEINKRLYMDPTTRQPHDGFTVLQQQLMGLLDAIAEQFGPRSRR